MHKLGNEKSFWKVSQSLVDLQREYLQPIPVTIEAEPQHISFDLQHTALIVIDMQNDFCSKDGWLDYIGGDYKILQSIISPLNDALAAFRNASIPIIWVNWGNRKDRLNISPSVLHVYNGDGEGIGIGNELPPHYSPVLEKDSWGAAILSELHVESSDIQVDKYRMSGFWDTPLDSILRNMRIDTILFAGVNIDQCVMATLQDAVCLGYDAVLLDDICATSSPKYCTDATLYNVKQCYGFVAKSTALIEAIHNKGVK